MTQLALNLSGYVNGVSKTHAQTTAKMFPGYAISNGVHAATWTHASFARFYDEALPQWALEPECWSGSTSFLTRRSAGRLSASGSRCL